MTFWRLKLPADRKPPSIEFPREASNRSPEVGCAGSALSSAWVISVIRTRPSMFGATACAAIAGNEGAPI